MLWLEGDYRGPLQGIPIGIKDNIATAGIRTTVGTTVLAGYVPKEDADVVVRCKQAGAIILGKENLEEFAAGATSNNPHYGAVHNPWALTTSREAPAEVAEPTWRPKSLSHRWGPTWAGPFGCPAPFVAWWDLSRRMAGEPTGIVSNELQWRSHRANDAIGC